MICKVRREYYGEILECRNLSKGEACISYDWGKYWLVYCYERLGERNSEIPLSEYEKSVIRKFMTPTDASKTLRLAKKYEGKAISGERPKKPPEKEENIIDRILKMLEESFKYLEVNI